MQLFLATATYSQLCFTEKQQSGAHPGCRCCTKLDQGLFDYVGFFIAVFGSVLSCCAASFSLICRE